MITMCENDLSQSLLEHNELVHSENIFISLPAFNGVRISFVPLLHIKCHIGNK